ncbi:hypothetical protein J2X36_001393 [Methylobacterium sp. BE186]|nr:hypothetical protein [Methylobacterium sp. BE186]
MTDEPTRPGPLPSRRFLLRAGAAAAALPLGFGASAVRAWGPARRRRSIPARSAARPPRRVRRDP